MTGNLPPSIGPIPQNIRGVIARKFTGVSPVLDGPSHPVMKFINLNFSGLTMAEAQQMETYVKTLLRNLGERNGTITMGQNSELGGSGGAARSPKNHSLIISLANKIDARGESQTRLVLAGIATHFLFAHHGNTPEGRAAVKEYMEQNIPSEPSNFQDARAHPVGVRRPGISV